MAEPAGPLRGRTASPRRRVRPWSSGRTSRRRGSPRRHTTSGPPPTGRTSRSWCPQPSSFVPMPSHAPPLTRRLFAGSPCRHSVAAQPRRAPAAEAEGRRRSGGHLGHPGGHGGLWHRPGDGRNLHESRCAPSTPNGAAVRLSLLLVATVEVAKTRLQLQVKGGTGPQYKGLVDCLIKTGRNEGIGLGGLQFVRKQSPTTT